MRLGLVALASVACNLTVVAYAIAQSPSIQTTPSQFVWNGLQTLQSNGYITDVRVVPVDSADGHSQMAALVWNDKRAPTLPSGNACIVPFGTNLERSCSDLARSEGGAPTNYGWNTYTLSASYGSSRSSALGQVYAPIFELDPSRRVVPNGPSIEAGQTRGQLLLPRALSTEETQTYAEALAQSLTTVTGDSSQLGESAHVAVLSASNGEIVASADANDQPPNVIEFWFDMGLVGLLVAVLVTTSLLFPGVRVLLIEILRHPGSYSEFQVSEGKIVVTRHRG